MNRLRSSYREWEVPRIIDVTRHHVLAAFSRGQFEAMPEGAAVEWVVDQSGPACSDAEDNSLAGTITKGDAFPTGHRFPTGPRRVPLPDRPRLGARQNLTGAAEGRSFRAAGGVGGRLGSEPNLGSLPPSVGSPAMRPPSDMPRASRAATVPPWPPPAERPGTGRPHRRPGGAVHPGDVDPRDRGLSTPTTCGSTRSTWPACGGACWGQDRCWP